MHVVGTVRLRENFILDEFSCRHCGAVVFPDERISEIAQMVRDEFNVPMRVVGHRCKVWNKAIFGAERSYHLTGEACDISPLNAIDIYLIPAIYEYLKTIDDIKGLGIYDGHVHYDRRKRIERITWDNRTVKPFSIGEFDYYDYGEV